MSVSDALSGIRVLDLSEGIAGPFGARLMAGLGADVIKVERPGTGDPSRRFGPFPGDRPDGSASGRFLSLNTGKRGITLDCTTPSGRDLLARLVDTSDAVIWTPRDAAYDGANQPAAPRWDKPGTSSHGSPIPEALRHERWPALVVTGVSQVGTIGPDKNRRQTELTLAARSSWIMSFGEPDREPLAFPGPQVSYLAGLQTAVASLAGILLAERTGRGQTIDVSALEANTAAFDQDMLGAAFIPNRLDKRIGRRQLRFPPRIIPTADGYVSMLVTDNQWPRFCRLCECEDLVDDLELRDHGGRTRRMEELEARCLPWFLERSKAEVVAAGQALGVPIAPFNNVRDLLADPHFVARGLFSEIDRPVPPAEAVRARPDQSAKGQVPGTAMPGRPFVLDRTPWAIRRPAPVLGEHNSAIYQEELGLRPADLLVLHAAGVI